MIRHKHLGLRGRLLGLVALVILPILLASVLFAARSYQQNIAAIESVRVQIVNDFAARGHIWFRGAARTVLATASGIPVSRNDSETCATGLLEAIRPNTGYLALLIHRPSEAPCAASQIPSIAADDLVALARSETVSPAKRRSDDHLFMPAHYGAWRKGGQTYAVVHVALPGGNGSTALLLADPAVIDATFEIGPLEGATVGLISPDRALLAQRGTIAGARGWLPEALPAHSGYLAFQSQVRGGETEPFAVMPVASSELSVVARFSREAETAAWRQYLIMAITPMAAALFLFIVYIVALQRDVLRWILGIKRAARARINDAMSETLAPIGDDMPRELRSVATAFNTMVRDSHAREAALTRSLDENRFLMRELHHRVKNSLQVIQSYLSLSQREAGRARRGDLAETEARVLVLSIAYRLALREDGMRPVAMRPLAEEVVGNLTSNLRADNQWVSLLADTDGALEVDRAIPFGLAIVEGVIAALRSPRCETVQVIVAAVEPRGHYQLRITTGGAQALRRPSARILQGLALQLQAKVAAAGDEEILNWTFAT